ncbi:hypothetical protein QRM37_004642 [Vibrio parahaemolyticus]|nr:hypothetical protein FORC72_1781 [Vibrio parahaemolyticus]ELA9868095.1 hypothetical protein [Vibrio parahaemolyticus]
MIFQLRSKFGIAALLICSLVLQNLGWAEGDLFVEALLGEFTASKAKLLAERMLSLVW